MIAFLAFGRRDRLSDHRHSAISRTAIAIPRTITALLTIAMLAGCASDPSVPLAHATAGICPSGTIVRGRAEVPVCEVLPRLERAVKR